MSESHAGDLLKNIKRFGVTAQGRIELVRHLEGGKNHRSAAMKAKCYDCCGYYDSGKVDCGVETCPLWPYMPFKGKTNGGK